MPQDWLERAVPPPPFVDWGEDPTFSRDGDSYRILWDEDGLRGTRHDPAIAPVIRHQGLGYRGN